MKRKGNKGKVSTMEYDILNIINIVNPANYVSIDTIVDDDDTGAEISAYHKALVELAQRQPSIEDKMIVFDAWQKLSSEAKETLLVLSFPTEELTEKIGSLKRKNITAKSVLKYALIQGYDSDKVMKELRGFAQLYLEIINP